MIDTLLMHLAKLILSLIFRSNQIVVFHWYGLQKSLSDFGIQRNPFQSRPPPDDADKSIPYWNFTSIFDCRKNVTYP